MFQLLNLMILLYRNIINIYNRFYKKQLSFIILFKLSKNRFWVKSNPEYVLENECIFFNYDI